MLRLPIPAPKACARNRFMFQLAVSGSLLCSVAITSACGSGHSATSDSSTGSPTGLTLTASLPSGTINSGYSGSVKASGGSAPYTFSLASGQLPAGIGLAAASGNISGTPTATGTSNFAVAVTDAKGATQQKALQISVSNNSSTAPPQNSANAGNSLYNLQKSEGWAQYGQGPPSFVDCSPSPCDGISFSMTQNVNSPSMSGAATVFNVGGSTPYSDALWNNHLIGQNSSQGMPDSNGSLVPNLHDFTYDVYFYADDFSPSEAIEFDVNQFFNGMGFIFGHECRIDSGNEWDVWDAQNSHWVSTGVPCHPNANSWNHLTLKVQRTSDDHLVYQSITLNGQTANLNWTFGHGSGQNWYGVTINFQMDGNSQQQSYNVYLDNLTLSYQ